MHTLCAGSIDITKELIEIMNTDEGLMERLFASTNAL